MYSVIFAQDVADELVAIDSPLERRKVIAAIQCLPLNPGETGIGEVVDVDGRIHRIGVSGGIAFVFRANHPLQRIEVLAVQAVYEE